MVELSLPVATAVRERRPELELLVREQSLPARGSSRVTRARRLA